MHQNLAIPDAVFQTFDVRSDPAQVAPRLAALRAQIAEQGLDGFLVPRADVHQGEYVPDCDARLEYVTGFTGSAGLAAIGTRTAALFVDSRYTIQAPQQTDTALLTVVDTTDTRPGQWIADHFSTGARIGFDPWLHTHGQITELEKPLAAVGITLVPSKNPVDAIWQDRPKPPQGPIEVLGHNRTGLSSADKLAQLRETMQAEGADAVVLTLPESLCWLFNIRGRDVPHSPFVLGFAIVTEKGTPTLFVDASKLVEDHRAALAGVAELADKSTFEVALSALAAQGKSVWFDPATAPSQVRTLLAEGGASLVEKRDPVLLPKAKKNAVELSGMREAQRHDAVALARFLAWFEKTAPGGALTEIDIVKKLEAFRRDAGALDVSFDTISGSGPNGAIVHYRVSEKSNRTLVPGELMLVDSGAQYATGTTDITRTLSTGPVTPAQQDHFTRVLKGMIAISRARFPVGTTGAQIDILARQFLWQAGLTYNHGTGHGVGAYLSVHEGPAGISPRYAIALEEGMVLSNEPGFYLEGQYGIRIENLVAVKKSGIGEGRYLDFETLTLTPIDTRLIDLSLLEQAERDWLNAYHTRTRDEIGSLLDGEDRVWLEKATEAI
ncbi:aminopeptidase P family protein [Pelagibacterium xiamenense]|uniref:aminopeptidase P family protein n=1 Tax=Pelagibacterium xiamenense TaxID=2901140 RepID=UPI001E2C6BE4|nr:aminopeptidase P family protein [Pelagibacterium xiamenense]MCD7060114.1 aminopeptidase P family protein [Pelagibacterium xiamenense]